MRHEKRPSRFAVQGRTPTERAGRRDQHTLLVSGDCRTDFYFPQGPVQLPANIGKVAETA